ncbi:helix-turn-helix domain-containing protein [Frigidibacter sp. RF13]|uniref:helix-turn-helix transcriptional regulator n=1 Tax=Frigidibacter sp. RF13 TaxID=2997340 RepID=UPI00226E5A9B|nr:helix-turn-helix domain-containing protein [Frigidibacter sp. RF13]MCY1128036.1 helix-turn-helix domain-containing protein [Frigidibacter sp. RF13]
MERAGSPKPDDHTSSSLLSERELADRWRISTRTLQRWRAERYGPVFIKIGGSIRYQLSDVVAFEEGGRRSANVPGRSG